MSTKALPFSDWEYDTPWRRLYWTFPAAIAIWVAIIWSFTVFMGGSSERLSEPAAVDARLIELPEPSQTARPAPVKQSSPKSAPPIAIPQPSLEKTSPPDPSTKPVIEQSNIPPVAPKQEVSPTQQAPSNAPNSATEHISARAIFKPIPQIPEELRQDALSASAVARFHVAPDGTSTVELIRSTPNPRLNRLLRSTRKSWRFFPSIKDGKPVESIEEVVIKVEVK